MVRTEFVKFAIRRIAWVIPVIVVTTGLIFSLIHIMPGSPASVLLPPDMRTERNIEALRREFQLNRPVYIQYLDWISGFFTGDMGDSFMFGRPVSSILWIGTKRTFLLGVVAIIIGTIVAIPVGIAGAVYKDTWVDDITRVGSISGISIPEFWLALLMIMVFAMMWNDAFGYPLIPSNGYAPLSEGVWGWFRHTIAPGIVLSVPYGATLARITRSSMADVLNEEYITTARSKGVKEKTIIWIHALRNALIPVVTVGAYQAGTILNGSVLVETVFSYPGLGWYIYRSALNQDFILLMGGTAVVVLVFVILNLLADIAYAWIDPRIDYDVVSN